MPEPIIINGKKFITSKQAAALTGYARDYVGQLVRMGNVKGKVIEKILFVSEDSLLAHVELKNGNAKVVENSFKNAIAESVALAQSVKTSPVAKELGAFFPKLNKVTTKTVAPAAKVIAPKISAPKLVSKFKTQATVSHTVSKIAPYADAIGKLSSFALKHAVGFAVIIALFSTSYASIHNPQAFLKNISQILTSSKVENDTPVQQASVLSSFSSFSKKVNADINDFFGIGKREGTTIVQLAPKVMVATSTIVKEVIRDIGTTTIVRYQTTAAPTVVNNTQGIDALVAEFNSFKIHQENQLEGIFRSISRGRSSGATTNTTVVNNNAEGTTTLTNLTVTNSSTSTIPNLDVTTSLTLNGNTIVDFVGSGLELTNGVLSASAGAGFSTTSSDYHFNTRLAATTTLNNLTTLRGLTDLITVNATTTTLALGSDYITDLTGTGLSVVNGALTVSGATGFSTTSTDYWETTQTRWATTSDSYAFDTRLAATTTLNNLTTLRGLTDTITTRATTTNATSTNFFATTASSTNLYASTFTAGSNALVVTSAGNVGIGTTSPSQMLTVGNNNQFTVSSAGAINAASTLTNGSYSMNAYLDFGSNSQSSIRARNSADLTFLTGASDERMRILQNNGNVGIGTTSPYAKLSVVGQTVSEYFTATSTTATSTFPNLSLTNLAVGSDYITDFTGSNLSIVNGALTATLDGAFSTTSADYWDTTKSRWATTSDSYAFGVNLSATTTLPNLNVLTGLATIGSTTGTTTLAGAAIFNGNVGIGTSSPTAVLNIKQVNDTSGVIINGSTVPTSYLKLYNDVTGYSNIDSSIGFRLRQAGTNIAFISTDATTDGFRMYDDMPISFGTTLATRYFTGRDNTSGNYRLSYGGAISDASKVRFTVDSSGNVGIGTTSPYAKLSVVGQTVSEYFTATSTTATSTFPKLTSTYINLGSDTINDFTGTGLINVGGALTLDTSASGLWATTSANWNFGVNLSATTTLPNLNVLTGLATIGSTSGTTTFAGGAIFNGNVGIGTTTALAKLQIVDNSTAAQIWSNSAAGANMKDWRLGFTTTSMFLGTLNENSSTFGDAAITIGRETSSNDVDYIDFAVNNEVNKMRFTNAGNFGIGTTTPQSTLSVAVGSITAGQLKSGLTIGGSHAAASGGTSIDFQVNGISNNMSRIGSVIGPAGTEGELVFYTTSSYSGISPTEKLRINGAGNIGIGTTSPYAKLSVVGQAVAQYFTATSTTATSTFPLLSSTAFALGSDYVTDLTGSNLSITNGALTVTLDGAFSTTSADYWETTQTRWATTSDSYAFGVNLSATTTLPNLNALTGLATIGSTSGTTTFAGGAIFNGSIGIGTTTFGSKLALAGGNFTHTASGTPTLAGTYNSSGQSNSVYVSGKYAYVADGTSGIQIVDTTIPQNPNLVGTYDTSGIANQVYVAGDYAYVADDSAGLQVINITNPKAPTLTSTYDTTGTALGVYVSGKYVYVTDGASGLHVFDASNPAALQLLGTYNTTGTAYGVYVSGKYAYVADYTSGLVIIDVSSPTTLNLVGSVGTTGAYKVYVSGKYAYVADNISGLVVVDVSNPSSPSSVGSYNTSGVAQDVYVSGKYAYVSDNGSGFYVIDIQNAAAPSLVGTYDTAGNSYGVFVSGKYAYVADYLSGLQVFDINGVDTPTLFAGNINTGVLTVSENVDIGNNLYVRNGLNIGRGGISSNGVLSITGTSTSYFAGNVGLGTTTPYAKLSVAGQTVADYFTATSTTATSTFPLLSVNALSLNGTYVNSLWATTSDSYAFDTRLAATSTLNNLTKIGTQSSLAFTNATGSSLYLTSLDCTLFTNGGKITTDNTGMLTCANDNSGSGGGGGTDVNWTFFNGSGISVSTTTNQVVIGASATSSLQKLQVSGGVYITGSLGVGTSSPSESLSINGSGLITGYVRSSYFTATSTTATSTFPNLAITNLLIGSDYITDLTGSGLSVVNGALTVDSTSAWATTSDSFAFDTRLAATTTLNNITTLGGLSLPITQTIGTLSVARGGTGQTSFGQGWLSSDGTTITSSTSPTVAYITATSTTATSTLHGNSYGADGIVLGANDKIYSSDGLSLFDTNNALSRFAFSTNNTYAASAAGQHRFNIGASQVAVIDALGNLGVGTSSPYAKLSVTNTGTAPSFLVEDSTSPDSSPFIIDASGNVGIGTTTPAYKLDVYGDSIRIGGGGSMIVNTDGNSLLVGTGANTAAAVSVSAGRAFVGYDGSNAYIQGGSGKGLNFNVNSATSGSGTVGTFTSAGNLGIGTTSPYAKLSVVGQTVSEYFTATSTTATSTFPKLTSTYINLGSDTINDFTGAGILNVGGALTLDTSASGLWATTSDSYAFGVNLSATTTLPNLNVLTGLATVGSSTGTTTFLGGTIFNGNVGIGTAAPTQILNVYRSGASTNVLIQADSNQQGALFLGDTTTALYRPVSTTRLSLYESSAERLTVSGGNVGIGTTSPYAKLSVTNTGSGPSFIVEDSTSIDSTPFIIDASGLVGIGTSTPVGNGLTISAASVPQLTFADQSLAAGTHNFLMRLNSGIGTGVFQIGSAVDAGSASVINLNLDRSGNVGIGTTTPGQKLEVMGIGRFDGTNTFSIGSDTNYKRIDTAGSGGQVFRFLNASNSLTGIRADSATFGSSYGSAAAPTNGMLIQGAVGIGTSSPATTLHIEGTNSVSGGLSIYSTAGTANGRLAIYPSGNTSTVIQKLATNGVISYLSSTGVEEMRIGADGNVGIGTTSPYAKLSVVGQTVSEYFTATSTTATSTFPKLTSTYLQVGSDTVNDLTGSGILNVGGALTLDTSGLWATTSANWNFGVNLSATTTLPNLNVLTGLATIGSTSGTTTFAGGALFNGTVGIGTTSPYAKFSVTNTGSGPSFLVEDSTSPDTTPFIIDASGNVGIGTSVMSGKVNIEGGAVYINSGNVSAGTVLYNKRNAIFDSGEAGTVALNVYGRTGQTADIFQIGSVISAGDIFTVRANGNIGIGTTSPYAKLSVVGQTVSEYFTATSTTATSTFPLLSVNALSLNGQYVTSLWATTSDSFAFDTRLAATTTLNNITTLGGLSLPITQTTGTLSVARGGTGQTSFGQGWLASDGTTITSSTSPTVAYLTSTSTATSTFRGGIDLTGTGCFAINGGCIGGGSSLSGAGAADRIAYWTGTESLSYSNSLAWDNVAGRLTVPTFEATASSSLLQLNGVTMLKADLSTGNFYAGQNAGNATTTGQYNTAVGLFSLSGVTTGTANSAFGRGSLLGVTTGSNNVGVGYNAAVNMTTGDDNIAIGTNSLGDLDGGSNNIAIGEAAGASLVSGTNNLFIGSAADTLADGVTNATAIGYNAKIGISNAISLGDVGTFVGIGTSSPFTALSVNGQTAADYFTAVSTSATSTLPLLQSTRVAINGSATANDNLLILDGGDDFERAIAFNNGGIQDGYLSFDHNLNDFKLWNKTAGTVLFGTNNIERLKITSAGYVGIGSSTPYERLSVAGHAVIDGTVRASIFTATSTTATSTFPLLSVNALSLNGVYTNALWATTSDSYAFDTRLAATSTLNSLNVLGGLATVGSSTGTTTFAGAAVFDESVDVAGVLRVEGFNHDVKIKGKVGSVGGLELFGGSDYNVGAGIVLRGASRATEADTIRFTRGAYVTSMLIDNEGYVGVGTTSPYQRLSVNGSAVVNGNILASTFTATSTTATSTFPLLSASAFALGSDYVTDLTGSNLSITNGALTVTLDGAFSTTSADYWETTQTRWATTSDSYAFGVNLSATTTLPNLNALTGLATIGSTTGTTNINSLAIFNQNVGIGTTSPAAFFAISNSATTPVDKDFILVASTTAGVSTTTLFKLASSGNISVGTTTDNRSKLEITNYNVTPVMNIDGSASGADIFRMYRSNANGGTGGYGMALKIQTSRPSFVFRSAMSSNSEGNIVNAITSDDITTGALIISTSTAVTLINTGIEPFYLKNSTSNIGLAGTSTPFGSVSINGVKQGVGEPTFVIGSSTKTDLIVTQAGAVGVATTSSWTKFAVNGRVAMQGLTAAAGTPNTVCMNSVTKEITENAATSCITSDRDQKQKIQDLTVSGLDAVRNMKPVTFAYNDFPDRNRIGFIAQDVQVVDQRLGDAFDKGGVARSIDLPAIMSITVKAVQELDTKVDAQASTTASQFLSVLGVKPTTADNFLVNGDLTFKNNFSVKGDDMDYLYIKSSTGSDVITFAKNGNVGIGTSTPAYKLQIAGDIAATAFVNVSTRDAKKNISYLNDDAKMDALEELSKMKIANYRYKTDSNSDPLRLGLIAEEAPASVLSASGKGVDLYKLTTFTLAAVQAQQKNIEAIDTRLAALEAIVASSTPAVSEGFIASVVSAIKDLTLAKLEVGTQAKPSGITLFDEESGEPYCIKMSGGTMKSTAGACGTTAEKPKEPVKEDPKPVSKPIENATTTATSTPPVEETPKEQATTTTPSTPVAETPKAEEPKKEESTPVVVPTPAVTTPETPKTEEPKKEVVAPEAPKEEAPKVEETKPEPAPEKPKEEAPKSTETASAPSVDSVN